MGRRVYLQERQIVPVGDSCDHRREPLSGMRYNYDLPAAPDNMRVCEHKAIRSDEEAAPQAAVRFYPDHGRLNASCYFTGR
ncbi:MAG: hypothetical protein DDT30_02167 [Dehalococcoidia bacterium]|nr:hypothetical protein [Bacillota bacterium]